MAGFTWKDSMKDEKRKLGLSYYLRQIDWFDRGMFENLKRTIFEGELSEESE